MHLPSHSIAFYLYLKYLSTPFYSYLIFRGKRIKKTPTTQAGYPKNAWYKYADISCDYQCQAIEYLYRGYCGYSGMGNGITHPDNFVEFKNAKKNDFLKNDNLFAALYKASELNTTKYRVPVLPVDGKYFGCAKCASGGKSYRGKKHRKLIFYSKE